MKSKYFLADVKLALLKYLRCLRELKKKNGEENDKQEEKNSEHL